MASLSHRQYTSYDPIVIRPLPVTRPSSPTNQLHRVSVTQTPHIIGYYLGNTQHQSVPQTGYIRWMKEASFELGTSSGYSQSNSPSKSAANHFINQSFIAPSPKGESRGYNPFAIDSRQTSNTGIISDSRRLLHEKTPILQNVYHSPHGAINSSFTRYKPISAKKVGRSSEKSFNLDSSVQLPGNSTQIAAYSSREGSPENAYSPESMHGSFATYFAQQASLQHIRPNNEQKSPAPPTSVAASDFRQTAKEYVSGSFLVQSRQDLDSLTANGGNLQQTPKVRSVVPAQSPLRKVSSVKLMSIGRRLSVPTPAEAVEITESPAPATPAERESVASYKNTEASASTSASPSWKPSQQMFSAFRHSFSSAVLPTPSQLLGAAGRPSVSSHRESFAMKPSNIPVKALLERINMATASRPTIIRLSGHSVYKVMYENNPVRLQSSLLSIWKEFFSTSVAQYKVCKQLSKQPSTEEKDQHPPQMLPLPLARKHKYLLVLDIDETLLHAEDVQINNRIMLDNAKKKYDFECKFDNPNGTKDIYGIRLRPFVREFLERMSRHFDLALYTASDAEYAGLVAQHLDPHRSLFCAVLSRQHCLRRGAVTVKDLSVFGSTDSLLIDNLLYSFCAQPKRGIPIRTFVDDANDRELEHLSALLPLLNEHESVEAFVDRVLHLQELYDALGAQIKVEKNPLHDLESILPQKVCQGHICQVTR